MSGASGTRPGLALLRDRFWLRALLFTLVLAAAFAVLGRWQWSRHLERAERSERVTANYAAPPVDLGEVLPEVTSALAEKDQWRTVRVRGRYDAAGTRLVRNRPLADLPGFEVLVPLRTGTGAVLLVDRGWVGTGRDSGAAAVPAPPEGEVTVLARLRPPEEGDDRDAPAGQVQQIDPVGIGTALGVPTYRAYAVLDREDPAPATRPLPLAAPEADVGINLSYAVQWWGFALTAFGVLGYYARQDLRRRSATASPDQAGEPDRPKAGIGRSGRSRPRELTDEEWEDAADR